MNLFQRHSHTLMLMSIASISATVKSSTIPPIEARTADLCPDTSQGSEASGYQIYCGYAVDPVNGNDTILPADVNVATFEDCLANCNTTDGCTGLSYISASTTCYLHTGAQTSAYQRDGWDGATKVGSQVNSNNTTTTTSTSSTATSTNTTSNTSKATNSAATSTTNTSNASTSTSSNPSKPIPSTPSRTITPGTIAGIAIGAATLAILSLLLILLLLRKRKQKRTFTITYPIEASKKNPNRSFGLLAKKPVKANRLSRLRSQLLAQKKGTPETETETGNEGVNEADANVSTSRGLVVGGQVESVHELDSQPVTPVSEMDSWSPSPRQELECSSVVPVSVSKVLPFQARSPAARPYSFEPGEAEHCRLIGS